MPRLQRIRGEFSTYHIIQRGNERKNIFEDESDKARFLEILAKAKEKYNFLVYCYCLMDNHLHLLMNDNGNDISKLMKSINVSYVSYFNRTHERLGHLFQDRFKSELVQDDRYLLAVSRYIHNNPVKAGMTAKPEMYKWSSYVFYSGLANDYLGLLDTAKVLGCFSTQRDVAVKKYISFVNEDSASEEIILDIDEDHELLSVENHDYVSSIHEARNKLEILLNRENLAMNDLSRNLPVRDQLIRELRKNSSLSLRDIGKLFGISESRVSRIVGKS